MQIMAIILCHKLPSIGLSGTELHWQGMIQDFWLGGDNIIMLECQTCIRYVIVLAILHILIGIGLTNKQFASWLSEALCLLCAPNNMGPNHHEWPTMAMLFLSIPHHAPCRVHSDNQLANCNNDVNFNDIFKLQNRCIKLYS